MSDQEDKPAEAAAEAPEPAAEEGKAPSAGVPTVSTSDKTTEVKVTSTSVSGDNVATVKESTTTNTTSSQRVYDDMEADRDFTSRIHELASEPGVTGTVRDSIYNHPVLMKNRPEGGTSAVLSKASREVIRKGYDLGFSQPQLKQMYDVGKHFSLSLTPYSCTCNVIYSQLPTYLPTYLGVHRCLKITAGKRVISPFNSEHSRRLMFVRNTS